MSREKAIEYLEAVGSKDVAIDAMVRSFSMLLCEVPSSVWMEFFMGLDYSHLINTVADRMSENMTDSELEELTAIVKNPLFQKHLKLYPVIVDALVEDSDQWLKRMRDAGELTRLEHLMRKAEIDDTIVERVVESFHYGADECEKEYVFDTGKGN